MKPSFETPNDKEVPHIQSQDHLASSVVIETPLQHWSKLHADFLMSQHFKHIFRQNT